MPGFIFQPLTLPYPIAVPLQLKKPSRPSECVILAAYLNAAPYASAEPLELQGKYIVPPSRVGKPSPAAENEMTQQEMWNFCENIIRGYLNQE